MKGLIFSRFDQTLGPVVFLKHPKYFEDQIVQRFTSLMDLHDSGFFIHTFGKYQGINGIFEVDSEYARGGREVLQISMIFTIESRIDNNFIREILEKFINTIKKIENLYKAFYNQSEQFEGNIEKKEELENLFYTFYESSKSAIRTLREVEIKYETLFKRARDVIIIFELKTGNIVDINIEGEKLIGEKRELIIQSNINFNQG